MVATIYSCAILGIDAIPIEIEVDVTGGLPNISIVGLADMAVKESKDRVKAAIRNTGLSYWPYRITINLAPAHIKKEGARFDLAIAIGILIGTKQITVEDISTYLFVAELALEGSTRHVKGVLPATIMAKERSFKSVVVPQENAKEASLVKGINVYPVGNLAAAIALLLNKCKPQPYTLSVASIDANTTAKQDIDFSEVRGQRHAKRALEIAVSGGHNILMIGPPGSGKTMLAQRLPTIMPAMSHDEALETAKIQSISGSMGSSNIWPLPRPFRDPHHTISSPGLIGGGTLPRPGETSRAHNGVLFLDELPEFRRDTLEALRQPLENRQVTITRSQQTLVFPAQFVLVAAMNPCPCGYFTDPKRECRCNPYQIQKYIAKISGPLLDRIDIHISIPAVKIEQLQGESNEETSLQIQKRVIQTRKRQIDRFSNTSNYTNAQMSTRLLKRHCTLAKPVQQYLIDTIQHLDLSARAYTKVLKVARTIADMEQTEDIQQPHIAEAIQYRILDKNVWV